MQKSNYIEALLVVAIVSAVGYGTVVIQAVTAPNAIDGNRAGANQLDSNRSPYNFGENFFSNWLDQGGNPPQGGDEQGVSAQGGGDQTSPLDNGPGVLGGATGPGNEGGSWDEGGQWGGAQGDGFGGAAGNRAANPPADGGSRETTPQTGGDNTGAREGASGQGGGEALDQWAAPAGPGATGQQDDFPVGISPSVGFEDQGAVSNDEGGTGVPSALDEWFELMDARKKPQEDAAHGAAQDADGARVETAGDTGPTDGGDDDVIPDDETGVYEEYTEEEGDGQDGDVADSVGSSDDTDEGGWWEFLFGPNNNGSAADEADIADINPDQIRDEEDKGMGIGDAIRGLFDWLSSF